MKPNELLWGFIFAALAALASRLDYRGLGGRLLGLGLIVAGWAVLGALVALGELSLGAGAAVAGFVTLGVIVGAVGDAVRPHLTKVRNPSRRLH